MKTLRHEQKHYRLVTLLFVALVVVGLSACGTSAETEDVSTAAVDGTGTDTQVDRALQSAAPNGEGDTTPSVQPVSDDADVGPKAQLADETGSASQSDADPVAPAAPESTAPVPAAPADDAAPESGDTPPGEAASGIDGSGDAVAAAVEAIPVTRTTYECPIGSSGEPSATAPFCTTTRDDEFPATSSTEIVCRDNDMQQGDDTCVQFVSDERRFLYECPSLDDLPSQQDNPAIGTRGRGPDLTCTVYTYKYTGFTSVEAICNADEVLEVREKYEGVSYPEGINICTTPGLPGRVDPVVVRSEYVCPDGWTEVPADAQTCTREERSSVPAIDGSCPEGDPVMVDGKVTTCVVVRTEKQAAEEVATYECPAGAAFIGFEDDGRHKCSYDRRAATTSSCPEEAVSIDPDRDEDRCKILIGQEEISRIVTPCPAGQAAITVGGQDCIDIPTYEAETAVRYGCPDDAVAHGSGNATTCSTSRVVRVDAIERTVIDYSCPTGSAGQPTESDPWCEKVGA